VVDAPGVRAALAIALAHKMKPIDPRTATFCTDAVTCMAGLADIMAVCPALEVP